jgi:DNA-binding MarR family transcriptional regulator
LPTTRGLAIAEPFVRSINPVASASHPGDERMSAKKDRKQEPTVNRFVFVPHYLGVLSNSFIWSQSRYFLDTYGHGVNEIRVISVLAYSGELSATGLCDALVMNKSIVSRTLAKLQEKAIIETDGGGRNQTFRLTDLGYDLNAKIVKISLAREDRLLRGLSDRDRVILLGYLAKMVDNLEHAGRFDELIPPLELDD